MTQAGLLEGQVAVVTGAGRGIGFAVAEALSAAGASVVVNDLGCSVAGDHPDPAVAKAAARRIQEAGRTAVADPHDVSTPEGAEGVMKAALDQFGRLDVLVNNAGILHDRTLLHLGYDAFDAVLRSHLHSTFLCTKAAAEIMRRGGGRIINTVSVAGMLGNYGQANEASAKGAVYALTRTASIELQKYDIRVNAVAPIAKTRMTEDLPMFEKVGDTLSARHVAPLYVFLASELSQEVTGMVLSAAGGRLSAYQLVESEGRLKDVDDGIWKPEEIAEHFGAITKL